MLFNSYTFLFFYLPIVFAVFFWIGNTSHRHAALWLVVASLFFYGWWNPAYVLLLLASIGFNYGMAYAIARARNATAGAPLFGRGAAGRATFVAVFANLALLAYFKYANFFLSTANQLGEFGWMRADIILPLGISFFTFTQIAFLIDTHRGIAREYNFVSYALFVTYFPHLIAGPLLHHKQVMPQFSSADTYRINLENVGLGLSIFTLGLFKKVVLADQFALYANPVFDAVAAGGEPKMVEAWIGILAYSLQLYFDFSGYSDMAIGLSKMFNVNLPINFNSPYKALSIIDFWRRWHMTLSEFLRDYLYIPLGGNRHGRLRRYAALSVTMLLGGLWHGANWTFVVWGGLHGVYLIINHAWRAVIARTSGRKIPGSRLLSAMLTMLAVVVAWVPFRAASLGDAGKILHGMAGLHGLSLPARLEAPLEALARFGVEFKGATPLTSLANTEAVVWLVLGFVVVRALPNTMAASVYLSRPTAGWQGALKAVIVAVLMAVAILNINKTSPFLYFNF